MISYCCCFIIEIQVGLFIGRISSGSIYFCSLAQNFDGIMKGLQIKPDNPECNEVLVLIISLVASVSRDLHVSYAFS